MVLASVLGERLTEGFQGQAQGDQQEGPAWEKGLPARYNLELLCGPVGARSQMSLDPARNCRVITWRAPHLLRCSRIVILWVWEAKANLSGQERYEELSSLV